VNLKYIFDKKNGEQNLHFGLANAAAIYAEMYICIRNISFQETRQYFFVKRVIIAKIIYA
jgi:hypothetical protein